MKTNVEVIVHSLSSTASLGIGRQGGTETVSCGFERGHKPKKQYHSAASDGIFLFV